MDKSKTKAIEIARRWPTPAMRLAGGKVAVPVEAIEAEGVFVPSGNVRRISGRAVVVVVA